MYNYISLTTITIVYLVFCLAAIWKKKYAYIFIHPFAFFCLFVVLLYRYASEIPEIATMADRSLALAFLLMSIIFWLAYRLLGEETIERFKAAISKRTGETEAGMSPWKFWGFLFAIVLIFAGFYYVTYQQVGNVEDMFFPGYNKALQERLRNQPPIQRPLWESVISRVSKMGLYVTVFMTFPLLFEALRKNSRVNHSFAIFCITILSLVTVTAMALTGVRTLCLLVVYALVMLVFFSFKNPEYRLSKLTSLILVLIVGYSLFCMAYQPIARRHKISNIGKVFTRFTAPQIVQQTISRTSASIHLNLSVVPDDVNFKIDRKSDEILGKIPSETHTPEDIEEMHSEYFENDENAENIKNIEEVKKTKKAEKVKKPEQEKPSDEELKLVAEEKAEMEKEKKYLKSVYAYGHSTSREVAWTMLYFGRHANYLGFLYPIKTHLYRLLPGVLRAPEYRKESLPTPGQIVSRFRGQRGGTLLGPFGDGYAAYGYTGAYFYCALFAFFGGVLGKISVNFFYSKSVNYEFLVFSLFTMYNCGMFMASHFSLYFVMLQGYVYFFFPYLLYVVFFGRKTVDQNREDAERITT